MKHLYVHIPFCRSRCGYCDFVSEPVGPHARAGRVERYLDALRVELADRVAGSSDLAGVPGASGVARAAGVPGARVPGTTTAGPDQRDPRLDIFETIYVGGGTPTVLPEDGLVTLVRELSGFLGGPRAELTVEANPGTIDCRLLERLARAGATRLSLGVQSFAPALRAALGRRVAQKEIEDALGAIAETGWCEWNIDLVFGIPGQTWDDAVADLETVVAAGPSHISLYDLAYTAAFSAHVDMTRGTGARPGSRRLGGGTLRWGGGETRGGGLWALRGVELRSTRSRVPAQPSVLERGGLPGHRCRRRFHGRRRAVDQPTVGRGLPGRLRGADRGPFSPYATVGEGHVGSADKRRGRRDRGHAGTHQPLPETGYSARAAWRGTVVNCA